MATEVKTRKIVLYTSIILFVISLPFECYCSSSNGCVASAMALLIGGPGVFGGEAGLAWLANPFLLTSWGLLKEDFKTSFLLSFAALIASVSFLFFDTVVDNGAGHSTITKIKIGYWIWVLSCFSMFIGNLIIYRIKKLTKNNQ